jgi:hypothetical protein
MCKWKVLLVGNSEALTFKVTHQSIKHGILQEKSLIWTVAKVTPW